MEDKEWLDIVQQLEKKLARAQKRGAVLYQKAKLLEEIIQIAKRHEEDARVRESDAGALIRQLIARQRELSVMLNRSNTLVARMYEANQMLSLEFKDAAKALPAPRRAEIEQKMAKIDELFKKTGIPDAQTSEVPAIEGSKPDTSDAHSFTISSDNPRRDSLWDPNRDDAPPVVKAEPVEEQPDGGFTVRPGAAKAPAEQIEPQMEPTEPEEDEEQMHEEISEDRRRRWWARFGFGQSSD